MLRGISRCLHGSTIPTKHRIAVPVYRSPFLVCSFLVRDLSSLGFEEGETSEQEITTTAAERGGPSVDQSFTSSHKVSDGRRFQFATVVARSMKKGESPLRIWDQACALIGGNSPTLAVAFVSKPTELALRTVQVLANQLSASLSSNSAVSPRQTDSSDSDSGSHASGTSSSEAVYRAEDVPFIGCLMDDSGGEIESSDDSGSKTLPGNLRGSSLRNLQFRSQAEFSHLIDGLEGQQDDRGPRVLGFRLGSSVRGSDGVDVQEEDEDGEDGTVSDWESLCSEYGADAIKVLDSKAESEDDEEDCENDSADRISKEGLVRFLNALVRHRNPFDDCGVGGDLRSLKRGDQNDGLQRTTLAGRDMERDRRALAKDATGDVLVTDLERCLNSLRQGFMPRESVSDRVVGSNGLFGDYEGTITVEQRKGGDKAGVSGSGVGKEDGNYKLVLCVGHMPGVKAVAFHSSTTGLPRLPDLENAVLENNPHMLLLGAPGFVFPDFIQRLASVFPASCRAGAFLSPLFTRKKNQWTRDATEKGVSPLFLGDQIFTSGVVGLAISSKDKGLDFPVGAFAEFARMSVGMPRIQGFIFLDESVSKNLFLPSNTVLQSFYGSSKGSQVPPNSLLEQLSRRLLRESAAPPRPQLSAADRPADPAVELNAIDDPERSQLLSSNPPEGDLSALDRLPLALLDSVLFPGWSMPFYIYEPCYRLMVRQCVEQGKPFGLSSMCSGSWAADAVESGEVIGTLVNLKIHTFERDCRSYIIAHGVRRFKVVDERIWSEPGSFGLNMGQVQFFDDKECETAEEKQELLDLAKRAVSLCCEVVSEAQTAPGLVKSAHDPRLASFAIGHLLKVPTRVKRRWLKMVNTKTRLLEQMTFLETKLPTSS
ncbi:unnamed protein product [Calypogeia fissa]